MTETEAAAAATTGMPPAVVSARSVAVGGAWTVAGRTIPLLYTFVISIAAARILGPVAMGRLALVVFAASTVIAVLSLGVAGALVRFIGESLGRGESDAARLLVRWAATLAAVGAVVSIAVFAIVAATVPTVAAAWLFAGIWVAATLIHAVPSVLLSGAQRWRQAVIVGLTTGTIHVAASLIALWAGGGVAALVAIDAGIAILNVIGTVWIARGELRRWSPVTASTRDLRPVVLRYGSGATAALALSFVFERRGEIVFLALFSADAEIALFAIPFSAVAVLALAPYALGTVTSTAYATLLGAGELGRIVSGYGRSLRLALLVTLPLTAIGVAAGPPVLSAVYGSEYDGAQPVLAILVAGLPLVVATSLAISLLQGLGRMRRQVAVFAAAAVANVALCLALVPRLDAIGAAIAHTGAYAVAALFAAGAAHRALPDVDARLMLLGRTAAAAAGAGALAAAVALPMQDAALAAVAALAVGTVGFVLLARALRIVPADDAEWLRGALGHRFGGRAGRVVSAFSPLAERT